MAENEEPGDRDASSEIAGVLDNARARKSEFDSFTEESTRLINSDVEKAKSGLSEIDQLKLSSATAKGVIDGLQQSASSDAGAIAQAKAQIDELRSSASAQSEKLNTQHSDLTNNLVPQRSIRFDLLLPGRARVPALPAVERGVPSLNASSTASSTLRWRA